MLGRIETVNDLMVALAAYDPEDKVTAMVYLKDQDAREATASEILAGPDDGGICLELSVYDSDFYGSPDAGTGQGSGEGAKVFLRACPQKKLRDSSEFSIIGNKPPAKGCAELGVHINGPHGSRLLEVANSYSCSFVPTDRHAEPTWTWAEDYSSATAVFENCDEGTCAMDGDTGSTYGSNVDATETATGVIYTASVTVDGKTYSDSKVVSFWEALQKAINAASNGTEETITLVHDCTATATDTALIIPAGKNITIDLNGHTIDRKRNEPVENGNVFTNNGILTLSGSGTVENGFNSGNGGAIVNNGMLNLTGATIRYNRSAEDGGAIYNSGTLNMGSGEISKKLFYEQRRRDLRKQRHDYHQRRKDHKQ